MKTNYVAAHIKILAMNVIDTNVENYLTCHHPFYPDIIIHVLRQKIVQSD